MSDGYQSQVVFNVDGKLAGITPFHLAVLSGVRAELIDGLDLSEKERFALAELKSAGAIDESGTVHPSLAAPVSWIQQANWVVNLETAGDVASHQHYLWGADEGVAALVEYQTGDYRLLRQGPTFLPNSLARLLRLGPRPEWSVPDPSVDTNLSLPDPEVIDSLFAQDPEVRQLGIRSVAASTETWGQAWVEALTTPARWQASRLTFLGGFGKDLEQSNVLCLIDAPPGIAVVTTDDESAALWPISPPACGPCLSA